MDKLKALIERPDFWAAFVGLVGVLALALFDTDIDEEAILTGILAIVGIFTASAGASEYQQRKVAEAEIRAQAERKE